MNKHFNFILVVTIALTTSTCLMSMHDQEINDFEARLATVNAPQDRKKITLSQEINEELIKFARAHKVFSSVKISSTSLTPENSEKVTLKPKATNSLKIEQRTPNKKKTKTQPTQITQPRVSNLDRFWTALITHDFDTAHTILVDCLPLNKLNAVYVPQKCSPLVYAAIQNDTKLLAKLIDMGADINGYSPCPQLLETHLKITPLCAAIMSGQVASAKLLINRNANVNLGTINTTSNRITTALSCVTQNLVCNTNVVRTPLLQSTLIQLLLKHDALQFDGKVLFMDHGSKAGFVLDLTTNLDKSLFKERYSTTDALNRIYCHNGDIIFLSSPINPELEQLIINRKEPIDTKELLKKALIARQSLKPILNNEENLSTTSKLSDESEENDVSDCEVLDFNELTFQDNSSEESKEL